ncbi:MAG: PQQ-binding-like beta-propeller repeat protein, partial [Candidatus Thorarchaeota archaeon]|nr:PQQ-binding-like beta-propeller repeat protein [Candidatus Thorarchaeota archaeon]
IISADVNGDSYPDVIIGVESCRILAIDGRDGSILWTTQNYSGMLIGIALQNTIPGEYDIIFGSDSGGIHAIQSEDGAHLWSKDLESPISTAPTIADVTGDGALEIIVGTESGSVVALGNNPVAVIWNITFPNPIDTALAIGDLGENRTLDLVVGCEDGTLYSIQLESSGRRIFWQGVGGASDFTRVGSMQLLDADEDMLSRYSEDVYACSKYNNDTDGDQILDGQDVALGLSPIFSDSDFDGLGDWEETYIYLTSGSNPDTDFDLLMDSLEINIYHTDPRNNDSDFDSLLDGLEVLVYGSSPLETDSDHDSLPDNMEVLSYGSSPTRNDTDFDLISDYDEVIIYNTNPNSTDSDQDQLSDYLEIFIYLSDPNSPDSDYDGALDGVEIYELGTEVNLADTDLDSYPDGWEAAYGFDPLSAVVPFYEPILYIGPYLLAVVVVAVVGYGAFRWKRSPRPEKEIDTSQEPDFISPTPDTGPQRKDVQYDLMDGVEKPWLYDGRESLMGEGGAHDFMQWLVKEESHAQDLVNQGKRHEALERLEMLVKYANQEKDLLTKIGPRTYLRTTERLENKIHSIRSTMNKPIE